MTALQAFQYFNPCRLVFGAGSLKRLGKAYSKDDKPLIVTDPGVAKAGLADKVRQTLDEAGIPCAMYDATEPDPPISQVREGTKLYQDEGCSGLIALGGGSSMDNAKAIGACVSSGLDVLEFTGGKPVTTPLPNFTAIPTTAGTGSEVTAVSVISDPDNVIKLVIRGLPQIAKTAILDPTLLASLPPRIAAETGADALTHAVEAVVGNGSHPMAQALGLGAIRMIGQNLRAMTADPSNQEAAGQMLTASTMAGLAFGSAGLGLVHALAHPIGAHYHISHGQTCGMFLPRVMEFNLIGAPDRFALIAQALGEDIGGLTEMEAAKAAVAAVMDLLEDIGFRLSYSELGVDFKLKNEMVEEVLGGLNRKNNPRRSERGDIEALFNSPS